MTIDLEEWFHGLEPDNSRWPEYPRRVDIGTNKILDVLSQYKSSATFFILGDVAKNNPQLIKEISAAGHEIGSHGMIHRFVYQQCPDSFREDLRQSLDLIQNITGQKCASYRAPYFSITRQSYWALDILKKEGIIHDSSIFPIRNYRYGNRSARRLPHQVIPGLWEWPVSTIPSPLGNIPCGGGVYFRFTPWRLTDMAIKALERKSEPSIFYLHPWEVDPGQPKFKRGSSFLRFRHYWGLNKTLDKLKQILRRHKFMSLQQGFESLTEFGENN